ncbi:MAG: preprotein translocase subunit SecG [Proteobacteria bacterium]|nr:MAG: preprotein translocase subunit SecG [Pseudomonadota bacterium]
MLYNILLILQIIVSVAMIVLILMQHGKGADAGAAFGSGASGTVFGSRGSGNFLSRTTAMLAAVFFLNSLGLAWLVSNRSVESSSIMNQVQIQESVDDAVEVPAAPVAVDSESTVPAPPAVEEDAVPVVPQEQSTIPTAPEILTPVQEQGDVVEVETTPAAASSSPSAAEAAQQ